MLAAYSLVALDATVMFSTVQPVNVLSQKRVPTKPPTLRVPAIVTPLTTQFVVEMVPSPR